MHSRIAFVKTGWSDTPILYARGNGKNDPWRRDFARLADRLVAGNSGNEPSPPGLAFPDAQQRKKVEEAAIEAAKRFFRKEYAVKDRQKDNCGYDLLAQHRKTDEELHVEVKGTSNSIMHFYMSRNEFRYMLSPQWRLIVVSDALGKRKVNLFDARSARQTFSIDPFAWEGTVKF